MKRRVYPSIPHLPGSRAASDRTLSPAVARRCVGPLASRDEVIVQEKLDGSCVAVVRRNGSLVALGRSGLACAGSELDWRRWFASWVAANASRFSFLQEGEVVVGEWLAVAHGTRYRLTNEPFVPFDLFKDGQRLTVDALSERLRGGGFVTPAVVHRGGPISIDDAAAKLGAGHHGAIDLPEGVVYRVERGTEVLLVAKWVRPTKVDGALLPENSCAPALYHWTPP